MNCSPQELNKKKSENIKLDDVFEDNTPGNIPNKKKLKKVNKILNINIANSLNFANVIADYYLSSVQEVLKMIVPITLEMILKVQNENIRNENLQNEKIKKNESKEEPLKKKALNTLESLKEKLKESKISFTKEQVFAVNEIRNSNIPVLLEGVTGSGKTEVYFAIIRDALESGNQVLFLVPEIALTNQTVLRFKKEFGISPTLWHSGISSHKKRAKQWLDIQNGSVSMVVGARSATFLPFSNLGLIVIDEEHDTSSYKQDSGVSFHARDALIFEWLLNSKSHLSDVPLIHRLSDKGDNSKIKSPNVINNSKMKMILGSATPSIESICRTMNSMDDCQSSEQISEPEELSQPSEFYDQINEFEDSSKLREDSLKLGQNPSKVCEDFSRTTFKHVKMHARFKETQRNVSLVDMSKTQKGQWISAELRSEIMNTIRNGEQAFLYLNRRGYSPHILCVECKERIMCKNCATWLVYYSHDKKFKCNLCGYEMNMLKSCASCNGKLVACGPGVERVKKELESFLGHKLFFENTFSDNNSSDNILSGNTHSDNIPSENYKNIKNTQSRIAVITSDTKKLQEAVNSIHNNEIDVFIATQILAKGHHFPNLTLVGVIDADAGMYGGDFRAPEKTYQLLTQVIGRSAREKNGKILLQTYFPQDSKFTSLIRDISKNVKSTRDTTDRNCNANDLEQTCDDFLTQEIDIRKQNNLPPFYKFISISVRSKNSIIAYEVAHRIFENISILRDSLQNTNLLDEADVNQKMTNTNDTNDFKILGPSKHAIYYTNRTYRWNLLVTVRKYDKAFRDSFKIALQNATEGMRLKDEGTNNVDKRAGEKDAKKQNYGKFSTSDYTLHIDVDPQSF